MVEVHQGLTNQRDGSNLYDQIALQTPYVQGIFYGWLKELSYDRYIIEPFAVHGELLIYVPKDEDDDLSAMHDFILSFVTAIGEPSSYQTGEFYPSGIRYKIDIETVKTQGVAKVDFGANGGGAINFLVGAS